MGGCRVRKHAAPRGHRRGKSPMTKRTLPLSVPSAYQRLLDESASRPEEAETERAIARSTKVRRLRRRVLRLEARVQRRHPDQKAFLLYADTRTALELARAEAHFDVGHERGRLVGHAERRGATAAGQTLVHDVVDAILRSSLPVALVTAVLLDTARALVLGRVPGGSATRAISRRRLGAVVQTRKAVPR